jgi:hypothetical protein
MLSQIKQIRMTNYEKFYFISFSPTTHEDCNTVQCILANGRVGLEIIINKIVGI